MEGKYFDLVCCVTDEEKHLFKAPMWSGLKPGDVVMVEPWNYQTASRGEIRMVVKDIMEMASEENEHYQFILSICEDLLPLRRIKSKVVYEPLRYDDDISVKGAEVSE